MSSLRTSATPYVDLKTLIKDRTRSPIEKIPNEVLLTIFSAVEIHLKPDTAHGIWVLQLVCKKWNKFVSASPTLWQNVAVRADAWGRLTESGHQSKQLAGVFARSQGRSLHVTFTCADSATILERYGQPVVDVMDTLVKQSHRFQSLTLNVSRHILFTMDPLLGPLENLKELYLQIDEANEDDIDASTDSEHRLVRAFRKAPNLQTVSTNSDSATLDIDWTTVTTLDNPNPNILHHASNLVSYTHSLFLAQVPLENRSLRLENLRTIELNGESCHWEKLVFPKLENATFNFHEFSHLDGLLALVSNSKCNLRSLTLTGQFKLDADLVKIIELNPSLEELSLIYLHYAFGEPADEKFADRFMNGLTNTPQNKRCLAPNLRQLTLELSATGIEFDSELTMAMWASRQKDVDDTKEKPFRVARLGACFIADLRHEMKDGKLSNSA